MDENFYIPLIIAIGVLSLFFGGAFYGLFLWSERFRKKEDSKNRSFWRMMHLESRQNSREIQHMMDENHKEATRILDEIQKTNKDNAVFLRMIFERVDKPRESLD